nr:hypothetical protein Iba_chr09aCG9470 [Ipomoea batatas]
MADSSTPDSSPPNSSLPDSSMDDIIVKLAEDRAASLPEDRWLSVSKPPSIWNLCIKSIDIIRTKAPEEYKIIVDICKLALNHYQESHPDKSYEFDSVPEGEEVLVRMIGFMNPEEELLLYMNVPCWNRVVFLVGFSFRTFRVVWRCFSFQIICSNNMYCTYFCSLNDVVWTSYLIQNLQRDASWTSFLHQAN